jgi:flavin-dependent dehydrogenase
MNSPTVLVVGGGVAGSACAIQLRAHGVHVTLVEKAEFPRSKVCGCCIGGAGIETLMQLGNPELATHPSVDNTLFQRVMDQAVQVNQWQASLGGHTIRVALPSGIAISREALDSMLIETAKNAGCEVHMPCKARVADIAPARVQVTLQHDSHEEQREFDIVILATGLNSPGITTLLPWKESPHGPFGVSWVARCEQIAPQVIHMACDHDGYVGLVRLESGHVDVAAALRSGSAAAQQGTPAERVQRILNRSTFPDFSWGPSSKVMTTPPLRRTRVAGTGRLMAIGDASGYVEPFTGEGMTWGLQSGIAAANRISSASKQTGNDVLSTIGHQWDRDQQKLLRGKKRTCRIVTNALRSGLARKTIGNMLATFPKLATPLIKHLS